MKRYEITLRIIIICGFLILSPLFALQAYSDEIQENSEHPTPLRLSLLQGDVSFHRPGSGQWTQAIINTPVAPEDELYTAAKAELELQIGTYCFLRAGPETFISLKAHDHDNVEFEAASGQVALDLRGIDSDKNIVINTPEASFFITSPGYYRLYINEEYTRIVARQNAKATAVMAGGNSLLISAGESVTIYTQPELKITSAAAPAADSWDKWNLNRTDDQINSQSSQYISISAYGLKELDSHGTWCVTSEYGPVWIPADVSSDWSPYSTGIWVRDPRYEWTWIDTSPWGWAPYHYGRWVHTAGSWCWAPGIAATRAVYSPALVAFYGQTGVKAGLASGDSFVGWIPLGWGEPVVAWWGRPKFSNRISTYRNWQIPGAFIMVKKSSFGHGPVSRIGIRGNLTGFRPLYSPPRINFLPVHFRPGFAEGHRPPAIRFNRPIVRYGRHPGPVRTGHAPARFEHRFPRTTPGPPPGVIRTPARPRIRPESPAHTGPYPGIRSAPAIRSASGTRTPPAIRPVPGTGRIPGMDQGRFKRNDHEMRPLPGKYNRSGPDAGKRTFPRDTPPQGPKSDNPGKSQDKVENPYPGSRPGAGGFSSTRRPGYQSPGPSYRPGPTSRQRPSANRGIRPYSGHSGIRPQSSP